MNLVLSFLGNIDDFKSVSSVSINDLSVNTLDKVGNSVLSNLMNLIIQVVLSLMSGIGVNNIAGAKILNTAPVHNPVGSVKAVTCNASAVAGLVEL